MNQGVNFRTVLTVKPLHTVGCAHVMAIGLYPEWNLMTLD
jgi:hypothetical protein